MKTLKLVGVLALFITFLSSCGGEADSAVQDAANKVEAEVEKQSEAASEVLDTAVKELEESEQELDNALEDL